MPTNKHDSTAQASDLEDNSKYKILTIDDERYIRQSIRTYLEDYGFIVFEAENGKKGIEVFEAQLPDLVLLDLRMPEMDGLQVLEILKARSPDTPLVVASGTGNITSVVEALRLGAWDYIFKPIEDMNVLHHSIQKCLRSSKLKRENKAYQEQLEALVKERTMELKQSEQLYKTVFEYSGTAAIIMEPDDTISMANSRFAELAGMERREIEGKKKWDEFVSSRDVEFVRNHIMAKNQMNYQNEVSSQYEIQFIDKAGSIKHVFASLGMIPGTDRKVASLLDVTEKKKAEQRWRGLEKQLRKSQKMEAIGTLAGGIAHDLNNILSPILGYSDMIMRTSEPGNQVYQRSEKIQKAALRAADLVSQVMSFNRGGAEAKRLIKLHPVAKEVVKLLRGSIPSTIRIVDKIDRNCPSVFADPTQIHQVIMNLCTNAYHAMEDTGGELIVGLTETNLSRTDMMEYPNLPQGDGVYLVLEVSDTGCGMAEDVLERIFDPYFTTKEEGKGTGLGLAMAYSIVQSCDGEIRVKSKYGKGTSFTIFFPAVRGDDEIENQETGHGWSTTSKGEHLLVVDDDPDIAMMCKEGFELLGYKVHAFSSSNDALSFFRENHAAIDLLVTDQTMPEKTGIELAKEFLKIKKDLPIILCSGYAGSISKTMAQKIGIQRFVMKPVTVESLSREVQQLLKKDQPEVKP
ncbi:MAG: response regulator [Proteobacteria bacterium]|nr:response regulator [Desulfobacula sp.]MBU3953771.1 response regulator [Pseudomonadota bacterium]MBU4130833.1 response regulator [Pseudomonadota bacterium]